MELFTLLVALCGCCAVTVVVVARRDLKLQNLFLDANHMIKIGDFGIARVLKHTNECAKVGHRAA